jgi:hypothetical protein
VRAEQKRPTRAAPQGSSQGEDNRHYEEQQRPPTRARHPGAGVKPFVIRACRFFVIAILLIAFEFFFGLDWPARNNAIVKDTGQQQEIHLDHWEPGWPEVKEHPAPGQRPLLQYDPIGPDSQIQPAK